MDKLAIGLARNKKVRIYAVVSTDLVEEARVKHNMWPTSTAALGRVMNVALMMAAMQKNKDEKLYIQIKGSGPINNIMVEAKSDGSVRGYLNDPHVMLTYNKNKKLAVGAAIGEGHLKVVKSMNLKTDFTGTVELVSGEIGDDFAYYFMVSEQTPSAVSVGVLVDTDNSVISSGGIIIQIMPDASEEDIVACEKVVENLKPVSQLVQEKKSAAKIIEDLFDDSQVLLKKEVFFKCNCSRERMLDGISTLTKAEINEMIEEKEDIETVCNFCNEKYKFTINDLKELINEKKA